MLNRQLTGSAQLVAVEVISIVLNNVKLSGQAVAEFLSLP